MHAYLVVVADSSRARLFGRKLKFSPLEELEALTHPESRLRRQDLVSDRPGTVHESSAHGESPADQRSDPKDQEARQFAREICARLQYWRQQGKVEAIGLVTEPRFLGLIRQYLDDESRRLVQQEIGANLTRETVEAITRKLDAGT
jgi:protein required for attachment to host cells